MLFLEDSCVLAVRVGWNGGGPHEQRFRCSPIRPRNRCSRSVRQPLRDRKLIRSPASHHIERCLLDSGDDARHITVPSLQYIVLYGILLISTYYTIVYTGLPYGWILIKQLEISLLNICNLYAKCPCCGKYFLERISSIETWEGQTRKCWWKCFKIEVLVSSQRTDGPSKDPQELQQVGIGGSQSLECPQPSPSDKKSEIRADRTAIPTCRLWPMNIGWSPVLPVYSILHCN